jgi:SAM-dependent methyltransferase
MKGKRAPRAHSSWDGQRETLDDLSEAVNYNRSIYGMLLPYLESPILEIGCGTGNLTQYLAPHGRLLAADVKKEYLDQARKRLKGVPGSEGVLFRRLNLERSLPSLKAFKPKTLICVNVLEHLQEDGRILDQCRNLLPPEGRLLLFVPALPFLYGSMDRSYGHYRRYSRRALELKMTRAGFRVDYCRYLNLLGIFGWWLNGKILKRRIIPRSQMLLYDRVVRFSSKIEAFLPKPVGLSLFCVGRKTAGR